MKNRSAPLLTMNLIDTNVILRYLIGDEKSASGVFNLFDRLIKNEEKVECPLIVFFQVIFVLKSFYKIELSKIRDIMQGLLSIPGFYVPQKAILTSTLDIWNKQGGDIVDAYIVALSTSERGRKIYSLDKDLDRITNLRIDLL